VTLSLGVYALVVTSFDGGEGEVLVEVYEIAHQKLRIGTVPSGSIIIIKTNTLHAGTTNRLGKRRRVLHGYRIAASASSSKTSGVGR
jgi:hypothetical protein